MNRSLRQRWLMLALLAVVFAPGCQQFDMRRRIPWKPEPHETASQPKKIVAVWADAVQHQPEKAPVRGFGGRIIFYGENSKQPVKVDGELVVYAFDDSNPQAPKRRYVFPAEQLPEFYSESVLGPSYSVWLPWDEAGGPRKEVSLIVRFKPKEGAMVVAESTRQLLPGLDPGAMPATQIAVVPATATHAGGTGFQATGYAQTVAYQQAIPGEGNPYPPGSGDMPQIMPTSAATPIAASDSTRRMATATITLPTSLSERMQLAQQQAAQQHEFTSQQAPNWAAQAVWRNAGGKWVCRGR